MHCSEIQNHQRRFFDKQLGSIEEWGQEKETKGNLERDTLLVLYPLLYQAHVRGPWRPHPISPSLCPKYQMRPMSFSRLPSWLQEVPWVCSVVYRSETGPILPSLAGFLIVSDPCSSLPTESTAVAVWFVAVMTYTLALPSMRSLLGSHQNSWVSLRVLLFLAKWKHTPNLQTPR